jgi:IS5 family transposase
MRQTTFATAEYENTKRVTKKERFLTEMQQIVPWQLLVDIISPFYHAGQTRGRRARDLILMIKMYLLQLWYSLSDEACEDECYSCLPFQKFLGVNLLGEETVPDATTLENFRHLIEEHNLADEIQLRILEMLDDKGFIMRGGTITDATIAAAASSTKNQDKQRDPEMKSTKKGNNYHFGTKIHIGTDAGSGAIVNSVVTAANEADVTQAVNCYREDDDVRYGDAGFLGAGERPEVKEFDDSNRDERTKENVDYRINKRPSSRTETHDYEVNFEKQIESRKASVRGKVEYPFYILKRIFGINRCIYKGLAKNANRFTMGLALVNLYMFKNRLAVTG